MLLQHLDLSELPSTKRIRNLCRVQSSDLDLGPGKQGVAAAANNIITTAAAANDSAPGNGNSIADASFSNNTKPAFFITGTRTASLSLTLASSRSQI